MQKHLRSDDFFVFEKYPIASFKLEKIVGNKATGVLKIKSIQKRIPFPISVKNIKKMISIEVKININHIEFGIKYNSTSYFQDLGDYAIE